MHSKIQVTPTQVELELKLGCDNNIGLDRYGCSFSWVWLMVWFGLIWLRGEKLNHITLFQSLKDIFRVPGGRRLRRSGIIVHSKIQVTPTQVELELKLGCDNNIGLDTYGCSFSWVWLMVGFGLIWLMG